MSHCVLLVKDNFTVNFIMWFSQTESGLFVFPDYKDKITISNEELVML